MIYIFIPAFNEQESIKSLINSTITTLKEANLNFKILVINDGSTDRTESILEDFKEDEEEKIKEITENIVKLIPTLIDKKIDLFSSKVNQNLNGI